MHSPPLQSRREETSAATRQALLAAARELFAAQGYQATGIEAVAQACRVTRGAFYHHFTDKRALFDALVVQLQTEAAAIVNQRARAEPGRWARLLAGIDASLDVCSERAFRRLVLQEGPSVLGLKRYREIDEAATLGAFTAALRSLQRSGELDFDDVELLSRMISAMVCEVILQLPDAPDAPRLRQRALQVMARVLDAFRRVRSAEGER